jgi:hypothetical protein
VRPSACAASGSSPKVGPHPRGLEILLCRTLVGHAVDPPDARGGREGRVAGDRRNHPVAPVQEAPCEFDESRNVSSSFISSVSIDGGQLLAPRFRLIV